MHVMWTNTAFGMYMGQHDAVTTAEFEPARRREVLLARLADTQCIVASPARASGIVGIASAALHAVTGRRLARS